jgi:tight adherence protein B
VIAQGVRFYAFGMQDPSFAASTLESLAQQSDGVYAQTSPSSVVSAYSQLGAQLGHQYLVSYRSPLRYGGPVSVALTVPGYPSVGAAYQNSSLPLASASKNQPWIRSTSAVFALCGVIALLIGLAAFMLLRRGNDVSARVGEFVSPSAKREKPRTLAELALGDKNARALSKDPRYRALSIELEVAGLSIGTAQALVFVAAATVLAAWAAYAASGKVVLAALGLAVPLLAYMLLRYLADRQRRLFESQLPDNLSIVASAMRAGQTILAALGAVVESAPEPSKSELGRAVSDAQLGVPINEALGGLGERIKSVEFEHVALIANLQTETGGNTAEVVEVVADTIRERLELRAMVRALTSQGRLAGLILSGLPAGLLAIVSVINPGYVHPLMHTTLGEIFLAFAVVMTVAGSFVIRKIVNIEL